MLVDDGTPGVNEAYAFQHLLAEEACNPLVNDLTGKIAVFYRGSCQFGTKAFNAQNDQDGDDEVRVKLDQGGEELTVPRDSIYQVLTTHF